MTWVVRRIFTFFYRDLNSLQNYDVITEYRVEYTIGLVSMSSTKWRLQQISRFRSSEIRGTLKVLFFGSSPWALKGYFHEGLFIPIAKTYFHYHVLNTLILMAQLLLKSIYERYN